VVGDWQPDVGSELRLGPSTECRVRTVLVVPILVTNELPQKLVVTQRDEDVTATLCLQRQNHAFHDSYATVLTRLAVPWCLDALALHPASECVTVEDAVAVADDVLRLPRSPDGPSRRPSQEAMVGAVTWKTRAACSSDQPRAAFNSRMANRSVGG
jgi:hypothetical protein